MAQDLKNMFKEDRLKVQSGAMPKGHEVRFLKRLEQEFPVTRPNHRFKLWGIAASITLLMALGFAAYRYFQNPEATIPMDEQAVALKSLGDVSPDLKKIEDYYVANINFELANVQLTPASKELFDSYIERLEALNKEYEKLSLELTESGPSELIVSALIDNLKLRLNLLYRLKEQLKEINASDQVQTMT